MDEINVKRIASFGEVGLFPVRSVVIKLFAIRMKLGAPREGVAVDAVVKALAGPGPGPVPETAEALIFVSAAGGHERSMRIFGTLGDDIDHSVNRICSPDSSARSPDDFDPLDILEQGVLDLPKNRSEEHTSELQSR